MKHDDDLDALFAELGIKATLMRFMASRRLPESGARKKKGKLKLIQLFQSTDIRDGNPKVASQGDLIESNLTAREARGKNSSRSLRQDSREETSLLMLKRIS